METYTLRGIESMLGISKAVIGSLVASGFVSPARGKRNEYRFTFQDVVLLRTAYGLRQANIAPRKILRSLRRLKESLPDEVPLSGLRITAVGNEVAVQEGDAQRQVDTGQLLFDFNIQSSSGTISVLTRGAAIPAGEESAQQWFARGSALEAQSTAAAEAAYRRAIGLARDYVDPVLNLGALLCEVGRCVEAIAVYRESLEHCAGEALLHFNLAVALEDLGRNAEALASYEAALALEPKLADAHFNAARLHELAGHSSQAIRHYSAYRRLQR